MFEVYAQDYRITIQEIPLGNQGEDMARCLVIDITDAVNEFGSGGTVSVRNKRNGDELPYFCTNVSTVTGADAEGNVHTYIKWTLTDVDTAAAGSGFVQADYIISGTTVKTWVYKYFILPSLGITGDVPDPYEDILEEIEAQVSAVQTAAASAAASAAQASAEATRIITTTESVVEDWLSEHIVTGYTVDDTLTISGAAADSKKAGDMIRAAFVTEETSGSIASFADGADDVPLKDLVVNITPTQTGTGDPSPTNIRSISGFTAANITRTSKNLFANVQYGKFIADGVIVDRDVRAHWGILYLPTPPGTYKLSITELDGYGGSFAIYNCDANKNIIGRYTSINTGAITLPYSYTFYSTASTPYFCFCGYNSAANGGVAMIGTTAQIQIERSDTVTEFEPYSDITYNVSFGSAGTVYGGTLDVTTGMLTVTHKTLDLGSLDYTFDSGNTQFYSNTVVGDVASPNWRQDLWCSCYKVSQLNSAQDQTDHLRGFANGRLYIVDFGYTDATAFKTARTGQTLVYPLAQPISVQLDPVSVASLLGQNNIWSDTGSVASCEYRADTKLYLEKLTNPDDDMVANANITSGSYFMVNNNLYLATAAIASGASIVPGTNCTLTNLASALNAINS